jgi:hypothetical protein
MSQSILSGVYLATEGSKTNPTDTLLLADTGAIATGGIYCVHVVGGSSAAGKVNIQRRNAANDANVGVVPILYGAAGEGIFVELKIEVETGERIRATNNGGLTGTQAVTLCAYREA